MAADRGNEANAPSTALDLMAAASLAFLAGATDVYGLTRLGDLFVSFMSGNTTSLGLAIGDDNWPRVRLILTLVGLFVAGSALGAAVEHLSGRRHDAVVAMLTVPALCLPLVWPEAAIVVLTFSMGMLNAALTKVGPAAAGLLRILSGREARAGFDEASRKRPARRLALTVPEPGRLLRIAGPASHRG